MLGRRFFLLALVVAVLLLLPYSGLSSYRPSSHRPYAELQGKLPEAFYDTDGDLLRDNEEPVYGTSPLDTDSDDDLCPDGVELRLWLELAANASVFEKERKLPAGDADGDGLANILDPDSDADGLLDGWEFENGLDPSTPWTFTEVLPDRHHYYSFFSGDPNDRDMDGMPDEYEQALGLTDPDGDPDADGVSNLGEYLNGTDPLGPDPLYGDVPVKPDDDDDGVPDELERALGLDPRRQDTDRDGLDDGIEMYEVRSDPFDPDTDGDGLEDGDEMAIGTSPVMVDTDGDGLIDPVEGATDPTVPDTDRDLIPDNEEFGEAMDTDGDRLPDVVERASMYMNGATDPLDPDTDDDGLLDGQEDSNRNGIRDGDDPTDRDSDWRRGGETDPTEADTDGGGMEDRVEMWLGRDPLDPSDDRIDVDPPDLPDPNINPPPPGNPIDLRGIGRLLLVGLLVLFVILLASMLYNTATTREDFLEELVEALEEGERVLYSITVTDDVREAVFAAYRRFLRVMAAYGHARQEPTTAREFGTQVRKVVPLGAEHLGEFTTLFELARYSDHPMDLGHRDRALAAFSAVRDAISRTLGVPEHPISEEDGEGGTPAVGLRGMLGRLRGRA